MATLLFSELRLFTAFASDLPRLLLLTLSGTDARELVLCKTLLPLDFSSLREVLTAAPDREDDWELRLAEETPWLLPEDLEEVPCELTAPDDLDEELPERTADEDLPDDTFPDDFELLLPDLTALLLLRLPEDELLTDLFPDCPLDRLLLLRLTAELEEPDLALTA